MNLFGTVLTYTAPSANYRGENLENRAVIQKVTNGRFEYPIISPEALRNAMREALRAMGLPSNRERLDDEEQLAVKFSHYPNDAEFADDFFFGWLIAATKSDRRSHKRDLILDESDSRGADVRDELSKSVNEVKEFAKKIKSEKDDGEKKNLKSEQTKVNNKIDSLVDAFSGLAFKQDSRLRMNMAVALEPYRHNSVFTQSPQNVDSPWQNAENSQLLHRETAVTPFQYPFALNLNDCASKPDWTKTLLKGIGELNSVAGNHARSYFEFAPASLVLRLTPQLVAGYNTYGFKVDGETQTLPEIIDGLKHDDYPGSEFYVGGAIVKQMSDEDQKELTDKGVTLDRSPQRLLDTVGNRAFAD